MPVAARPPCPVRVVGLRPPCPVRVVGLRPPCPVRVVGLRRGYRLKSLPQATPRQQATRSPELRRRRLSPDLPAQQPPQASTRQIVIVLPRWIVTAPPPCHADRSELARSSLVECPQSPGSSCVRSSPPTSPRPQHSSCTQPDDEFGKLLQKCWRRTTNQEAPPREERWIAFKASGIASCSAVHPARSASAARRRGGSDDDGAGRSQ